MKRIFNLTSVIMMLSLALMGCECDHEYDDGKVTKEATCAEEGEITYTCELCDNTKVKSIDKIEHTYDSGKIAKEATCTEEGEKIYTCEVCEETKSESIDIIDHEYDNGTVTKEATFENEGELTIKCKNCKDSYTEVIPIRDDEVVVTVTKKTNLPENWDAGRYSDRVEFTFKVENKTKKTVKGVQGIMTISDLFGEEILSIKCDFTGDTIKPNGSIVVDTLGMDINQFKDSHTELYNADFSDLQFEYVVVNVVYSDGSGMQDNTEDVVENEKVVVKTIDKKNLSEDWDANRYSPRVEFTFEIFNNTTKDIKGVQGVLKIKDLFGVDIMSVSVDFTGQTIKAKGKITNSDMGMDINEFMDKHVKLYNTDFDDLKFEYEVTSIVYSDGTKE